MPRQLGTSARLKTQRSTESNGAKLKWQKAARSIIKRVCALAAPARRPFGGNFNDFVSPVSILWPRTNRR